ncbi:hypothetical protein [Sphingopyxis sp.]
MSGPDFHYPRRRAVRRRKPARSRQSVGSVLVAEGLARRWEGQRRPWC